MISEDHRSRFDVVGDVRTVLSGSIPQDLKRTQLLALVVELLLDIRDNTEARVPKK